MAMKKLYMLIPKNTCFMFPEQDMGKKLAYMLDKNDVMEHIRFSDEYSIVEKKVPLSWIGKSILELDVRKRYHIMTSFLL